MIRTDEIWLVLLAGIVGLGVGLIVALMIGASRLLHLMLFATYSGDGCGAAYVDPLRIVAVPVVGGAMIGLPGLELSRRRRTTIVDPDPTGCLAPAVELDTFRFNDIK